MSHGFYIALSYGLAALVVLLLVGWVWMDGRARQRELAELDAAGIRRRSARTGGDTTP